MASSDTTVLRRVRRWLSRPAHAAGSDAELVRRFAAARDEAAFAAIVDRHGPMVLGTARRAAGDHHAGEDAFQATFLALARHAARLRNPDALAAWLHRTAHHLGRKAARAAARRRRAEAQPAPPRPEARDELTARELLAALDDELNRLPEGLRLPLVLCCLEGLTQDEAAARLGWTPAAIRGRLERGRRILRDRLARRGLTFAAVGAALVVGTPDVSAALRASALQTVTGAPSAAVLALADSRGGVPAMWWAAVAAIGVAFGMVGSGQKPAVDPPAPPVEQGDQLPTGAVARLGWSPHRIGNSAFALSANEKEIIAVSPQGVVCRFDSATGKPLSRKQLGSRDDVESYGQPSASISADGTRAEINEMVGRDSRVTVWDVPAGKVLFRREPEKGVRVGASALSPDGNVLAIHEYAEKTLLRVYDVATGKVRDFGEIEFNVYGMIFSADGKRLVVSETSSTPGPREERDFYSCFDVASGTRLWKHKRDGSNFGVSRDGRLVASAGFKRSGFNIIDTDPDTLKPSDRNQPSRAAHPNVPHAFAPDGRTLLIDYFEELVLWDTTDGKEVGAVRKVRAGSGYGPKVGGFSADGKTVLTNHRALGRWNLVTGRPVFETHSGDGLAGPVEHVAFSTDGSKVFAQGWSIDAAVWDAATGKQAAFRRERSGCQFVTTPEGVRGLWCDHSKSGHVIELFDPVAGTKLPPVTWTVQKEVSVNGMRAYALAADGRTLMVFTSDEPWKKDGKSTVTLHDIPTNRRVARYELPGVRNFWQSPFSPCGRWAVFGGRVYHLPTGTELFDPTADDNALRGGPGRSGDWPVWFSADGRLLAGRVGKMAGEEWIDSGAIVVWELASGKVLTKLAKCGTVTQLAFAPGGRTAAVADAAGVRVYDLTTGGVLATFQTPDINAGARERGAAHQTLVFSPDGKQLATGHQDGSVTLWAVPQPAVPPAAVGLWEGLASALPAAARETVLRGTADHVASVKALSAAFQPPAAKPDPAIAALIAALDDDDFASREAASKQLKAAGAAAEAAMRKALTQNPSPEARRRIAEVLAGMPIAPQKLPVGGDTLRLVRAMEVLERAGTPAARALLATWADQTADPRVASEATAALRRMPRAALINKAD
jgi:RNA polymerase sigma factor (sigma-70 family)